MIEIAANHTSDIIAIDSRTANCLFYLSYLFNMYSVYEHDQWISIYSVCTKVAVSHSGLW